MKKILFLLILSMIVFSGCKKEEKYTIALITDIGDIDDRSFNQGTWEGVQQYAQEYGISHKYYKPTAKSTDAYVSAINLAISNGAKIVVTPGYLFEEAVEISQKAHPEVKFVLIDGNPANATVESKQGTLETNTYSILYAEEQVGFLAGYAAVKDGHTKLGFMGGMAVPAVIKYGQGFIFGASAAAVEEDVDITIQYHYTGNFIASPEVQTTAATMYANGITCIFAAGGAVGQSVMSAAELSSNNGKVIGVDVDQSADSNTVITSATKGLGISAYRALESFFGGDWEAEVGGKSVILDAAKDGVGLTMATSRFTTFNQAAYEELFADLVAEQFSIPYDIDKANKENTLNAPKVSVTVVGGGTQ
ncbi:MAG: BMP family ABC transporter substrate-binding protein [Acholeplasmataceae bacterium]|nr:BMP family ABC transporter substrate-binding protein [Acholeplasmataceae bacterium]